MTGSNIFDYIYRHDQQELADKLHLPLPTTLDGCHSMRSTASNTLDSADSSDEPASTDSSTKQSADDGIIPSRLECFMCVRMKSTLTKRGVHLKSAGFRVVQLVARSGPQAEHKSTSTRGLWVTAVALPIPTMNEFLLDAASFVIRLQPNFTVVHCEQRISELTSMTSDDVLHRKLYDFCHVVDLETLRNAHSDVLNKGQSLSDYWRLLNRNGGYIWTQMRSTLTCSTKNPDDQHIVVVVYVLSGPECVDQILTVDQMMTKEIITVNGRLSATASSSSSDTPSHMLKHCPTITSSTHGFAQSPRLQTRLNDRCGVSQGHLENPSQFQAGLRVEMRPSCGYCKANEPDSGMTVASRRLTLMSTWKGSSQPATDASTDNTVTRYSTPPGVPPSSFSVLDLERAMDKHLPVSEGCRAGSPREATSLLASNRRRSKVWSVCWTSDAPVSDQSRMTSSVIATRCGLQSSASLLPASSLLRSLHDAAISRCQRDTVIRGADTEYGLDHQAGCATSDCHQSSVSTPVEKRGHVDHSELFIGTHGQISSYGLEVGAVGEEFQTVAEPVEASHFRFESHNMEKINDATYNIDENNDGMWLHLATATIPYHTLITQNWNDVVPK